MWWVDEMLKKNVVVVRYSQVEIKDRRDAYNTCTEDLFDVVFADEVKDVPLSKDPVWKGLVEKFDRLGYELGTPEKVTRIQERFSPQWEYSYRFDRIDEEERAQLEQDGVLCLPS